MIIRANLFMSWAFTLALCGAFFAAAMALSTALRGGRSIAHWSFAAGMAILAVESLCAGLACDALDPDSVIHWETLSLGANSLLAGVWLLFSLTYGRGNYREFLDKWRLLLYGAFLVPVALYLGFRSRLLLPIAQADGRWLLHVGAAGLALNLLFLLCAILVLMNLEGTFRSSVGTTRWRIKFMILGLGVLFAVRAYTSSQLLLFRAVDLSLHEIDSAALIAACLLILRSLLRTAHFDVSVYPSQTILYSSFTIILAGVYLIIVGVLAKSVAFFGGNASFELKAFLVLVSLVLLCVLLLSDRFRLYTKRFVSRHFQRPMYDYRTVWRTFTEGTARRVEQSDLCSSVAKLVSEVFHALSVSIWLIDEKKEMLTFVASTSMSYEQGASLNLSVAETEAIVNALSQRDEPVDIDSAKEAWADALRRSHPDEFSRGGNRVCVPLMAGGELLGIIILGDRVAGAAFSLQDFDLLKSAAHQAAASLLNVRLSQQLSQAKQLEAFQAMSAFFVHDLKNTASTLSLMLKNLPVHYQDPRFREDALRGISKTVTHINDIISRLTVLRHDLAIQPVDCDLNQLIADTLKGQEHIPGIELEKRLENLPKVRLDPGQIQKVLMNLILNAREAMPAGGKVLIRTNQNNGWAVLSVVDTGCGMTPEFLKRSLFRPFSTTKKTGIGIGMFHCKMIVESHHGRIEVESELGKGSAVRVLLPITRKQPAAHET